MPLKTATGTQRLKQQLLAFSGRRISGCHCGLKIKDTNTGFVSPNLNKTNPNLMMAILIYSMATAMTWRHGDMA